MRTAACGDRTAQCLQAIRGLQQLVLNFAADATTPLAPALVLRTTVPAAALGYTCATCALRADAKIVRCVGPKLNVLTSRRAPLGSNVWMFQTDLRR